MKKIDRQKKSLIRDCVGAVSVEFVLMVSLLVFTITTMFVTVDAFLAANKGIKGNAIVSNIASRNQDPEGFDKQFFDDLYTLFQNTAVARPEDAYIRLTVVENVAGNLSVKWSVSTDLSEPCIAFEDAILDEYVPNVIDGDQVILLETSRNYTPFFRSTPYGEMTFEHTTVFIPRFVPQLDYDETNKPTGLCSYNPQGTLIEDPGKDPTDPSNEDDDYDDNLNDNISDGST
ncbi:MAG: hypothetical protein AAF198_05765 [Pseudomonadota bacterium]